MANTQNFNLEGKVALVTGASYGIGYAIAKALATAGAKIVFNDIKQELVDKGIEAYKADGTISGGMIPKLDNAFTAISKGVKEVVITSANHILSGGTKIK